MPVFQKNDMDKRNGKTIIPVQLPEELREELEGLKKAKFPEKTEVELYCLAVRTGLDKWKGKNE